MNKLAWTLAATMGLSLCATVIEPGKLPENFDPHKVEIRKLVESTPRGGLPNFYAKLDSKQDTVIAYFGGSITAQAGYRVHSLKYFQEEYNETKVTEINAAIGGTGSDLGAYRLEHDVLTFKPDLVFVEFAVNDGGASPYSIRQSMEGIVRHIWKELPSCDIIFVYTLTAGNVKELQDGKMQRSASVMEEIADYYQIPSIHMGVEIVALEKQGKLLMKASNEGMTRVSGKELNLSADNYVNAEGKIPFANDGVHPYDNTGHALYMDAIRRSLPAIKSAGKPGPKTDLPKPMVPDCLENVITIPFGNPAVKLEGPCQKLPKDNPVTRHFLNRADEFYVFEPGATITFKYKGLRAAIYNLLGPQGGIIEIKHNGEVNREARMFDPYCTYHRLATVGLPNTKDQINEITITVLDKNFDKKAILFDHNKPDFDKNPAKYEKLRLYAGCIFIVGELVP